MEMYVSFTAAINLKNKILKKNFHVEKKYSVLSKENPDLKNYID